MSSDRRMSTDSDGLRLFEAHRARLFAIAYRMLGTVEDAEDMVQEAFLRWNGVDRTTIDNPPAWLASAVRDGDVDGVVQLLARDATMSVDSGGAVRAAARRPIQGALAIAQFLVGVNRKVAPPGLLRHVVAINGEPALVTTLDGTPQQ